MYLDNAATTKCSVNQLHDLIDEINDKNLYAICQYKSTKNDSPGCSLHVFSPCFETFPGLS